MSYSFSINGPIKAVRKHVADVYESGHGTRQAKHLVNHQLDMLEAQGATHVKGSAFGNYNGSEHTIKVARDYDAEAAANRDRERKAYEDWDKAGRDQGFLRTEGDKTILSKPSNAMTPGSVMAASTDSSPSSKSS
jgi:hypothetical protein